MQHYYRAFSQHSDEAENKIDYIKEELLPFTQYLQTSIKALERKEVQARWQKIESHNATLELYGYLYAYNPLSSIELLLPKELFTAVLFCENIPEEKDFSERLILTLKNGEKEKRELQENDIFQGENALFRIQKNENAEANEKDIQDKECMQKDSKGFLFIENIALDSIAKISWNGENIAFQTLEKWLSNGSVELDSKRYAIKGFHNNSISLTHNITTANTITKDGFFLPAKITNQTITGNYKVIENGIIYTEERLTSPLCKELSKSEILKFCNKESLRTLRGETIALEYKEANKVLVKEPQKLLDISTRLIDKNGISYTLKKEKSSFYVKLLPLDENGGEEEIESPLRFFLDADIEIEAKIMDKGQIKTRACRAKIIDYDEFLLTLLYKGREIFPLEDSILETKPNTYPLQCQKKAITTLLYRPISAQHTLLKLFASRKENSTSFLQEKRESSLYNEEVQWAVLTDSNRKGAQVQRDFVTKALHTEDFAILEGPPGSGKTTVILELIVQLILQKKRVLLCGSTHVAIDNVLERLQSKKLIQKYGIFPIRIGSEGAISEEANAFRLGDFYRGYADSLLETYNVYDDIEEKKDSKKGEQDSTPKGKIGLQFFLQCANLVCGTTIGILQYPAFKTAQNKETPITPEFDYLIIDESSKTTFQEFLVPAMWAKKWILVGDTRQLSPFVDSDELQQNIENLPLNYNKSKKEFDFLESGYQKACFLLFKMAEMYKTNEYKLKMAVGLKSEMLEILENEIEARENKKGYTFGVLNHKLQIGFVRGFEKDSLKQYLENMQKDWIFYDEALAQTAYDEKLENPLAKIIPHDFLDITQTNWQQKSATYQQRALQNQEIKNYVLQRKMQQTMSFDTFLPALQKELQEKSFASEIAWRLNREFEKRVFGNDSINDSKGSDSKHRFKNARSYTRVIDELLPQSHEKERMIKNKLATIANIALPSILEALIKGVNDRSGGNVDSFLRSGFNKEELESRHCILSTQGRMHEDISAFPREEFYKEANALQDLENLNREWGYTRYKNRSVWIDVRGNGYRGKNEGEAKKLISELESFINFAKDTPHPLKNEGEEWSVAVLSFYKGQTRILESKLRDFTGLQYKSTDFSRNWHGNNGETRINIKLCSVDKFQGQEADIVFLSMVNTNKIGFLDSPNRLNVGITRAKFQLVILGDYEFFSKECRDSMLENFAKAQTVQNPKYKDIK